MKKLIISSLLMFVSLSSHSETMPDMNKESCQVMGKLFSTFTRDSLPVQVDSVTTYDAISAMWVINQCAVSVVYTVDYKLMSKKYDISYDVLVKYLKSDDGKKSSHETMIKILMDSLGNEMVNTKSVSFTGNYLSKNDEVKSFKVDVINNK